MSKLSKPSEKDLEQKIQSEKLFMGKLGYLFGKGKNAQTNIIGLILLMLIIVLSIFSFFHPVEALDYWKALLPIITLALGYIAGKEKS